MKKNYVALGGLFACLHVLFLLLGKIVVGSELLMVLILPFLSTMYTLKCDKKSVLMFVIATLLLCSVFDVVSTFIYVVPSLMCGITYGLLRKKNCKELELLCLSGLVHVLSIGFSFLVIVLLFKEMDFLSIFEKVFSLTGERLVVVSLLTLLVLAYCEAFLVHMISDNEIGKFMNKVEKNDHVPKWFLIPVGVSLSIFMILYFANNLYSVFPMVILFVFLIPYIIEGMLNFKYKVLTVSLVMLFSFISIYVMKYIEPINLLIVPVFICLPFIVNNFKDNSEKIF